MTYCDMARVRARESDAAGDEGDEEGQRDRTLRLPAGNEHRHSPAVLSVLRVIRHQVALLPADRENDVSSRREREDEVRNGHCGRCPKGEKPADVERMPHILV